MDALRAAALIITMALSAHAAPAARPGVTAYNGTGAWVDRYDFGRIEDPEFAVAEMADYGVQTLYLETGSWKVRRGRDIVAPEATSEMIDAAHAEGMKVVAWYLPGLDDRRLDLRRVRAALNFRSATGQQFDSFALDIEATNVNPVWKRNASLMRLSRSIRREVGDGYALGAIVPDKLSTSNGPVLWPRFPFKEAAHYYDVFLPMAYSTFNRARGAARVYSYTADNVRFLRAATGRPVHLIGGITDAMPAAEQRAVARGARDAGAVGVSLYKYPLYDDGSWTALSSFASSSPSTR